jgi:hypothetical protein
MRRILLAGVAALLIATPATAEMSVATFLTKADALKAKGFLAIGSPDIGLLQGEMKGVTTQYRADIDGAKVAGRKPHSCPPPKGQTKLKSDDLMAYFRTIPAPQRPKTSVRSAFYSLMRQRFPCPV